MTKEVPRLRMFAGPNGSGKSTFKHHIRPQLLGIYINPDEIEKEVKSKGYLDFQNYQISLKKTVQFIMVNRNMNALHVKDSLS